MKCNQSRPGFELVSPCPFPTLITITPWAPPQCHEEILHHHNAKMVERYDRYTHNLCSLWTGDKVAIQSPLNYQCNTTGKIITVLPECQYWIRGDGSGRITLRNSRLLRKWEIKAIPTPISCATPVPITSTNNALLLHPESPTSSGDGTCAAIESHPPERPHIWLSEKFLLCPGYSQIPGQASKKGTALIQPCFMEGGVEVTTLMCRITTKIITLTDPGVSIDRQK